MRGKRDNGNRMEQVAHAIGSLIPGANRKVNRGETQKGTTRKTRRGTREENKMAQ